MNNKTYLYLFLDISSIIIPFISGFHKKINLHKKFPFIFIANLIVMIPFIIWDYIFVGAKIWGFNEKYITGIKILNLPIEEYLFFICIPFACVFTHLALWKVLKISKLTSNIHLLPLLLILMASIFFIFQSKIYTKLVGFVTLISSLFTLFLYRTNIIKFAKEFAISYLILLFPFLIVNGTLTGSFTAEPIVWYNENAILGIRVLTIPIEDFLYAFSLIILNIALVDFLIKLKNH